jgi:hypothetical protein
MKKILYYCFKQMNEPYFPIYSKDEKKYINTKYIISLMLHLTNDNMIEYINSNTSCKDKMYLEYVNSIIPSKIIPKREYTKTTICILDTVSYCCFNECDKRSAKILSNKIRSEEEGDYLEYLNTGEIKECNRLLNLLKGEICRLLTFI